MVGLDSLVPSAGENAAPSFLPTPLQTLPSIAGHWHALPPKPSPHAHVPILLVFFEFIRKRSVFPNTQK